MEKGDISDGREGRGTRGKESGGERREGEDQLNV